MTPPLQHVVEPERLLLTWQPPDDGTSIRTRRIVAELTRSDDPESVTFTYLFDTTDFLAAKEAGFAGYPAFRPKIATHTQGVMSAFMRRLPPRKREDFGAYLAQHWLPNPFVLSDFALLGYTGAKLPSDGFALVPVFDPARLPCEYVTEIAGTRHMEAGAFDCAQVGDVVTLAADPTNPVDPKALLVMKGEVRLGYINRALLPAVHGWLQYANLHCELVKKAERQGRPLLYIKLTATP